jgi:hypothetical protein
VPCARVGAAGQEFDWKELLMRAFSQAFVCIFWLSSTLADFDIASRASRIAALFTAKSLADVHAEITAMRPPAVSASDKQILLRDLPQVTGSTRVTGPQLDCLAARLQTTLEFHGRAGVVELVLFRDPRPIVFSKPGVVVGLSTEVVKLVGDDDAALVGVVAHELAHEYVAIAKFDARASKDKVKLQELELFCDGVAVVTLLALRLDPARYSTALTKICTHSHAAREMNDGSGTHPALATRLRLIAEIDARKRSH